MTNQLAIVLGVVVVALIVADIALNQGQAGLFLAKKMLDMTEYIAFWR